MKQTLFDAGALPVNELLSLEPTDTFRACGVERIIVRIMEYTQRHHPHGACFVLWVNYSHPHKDPVRPPKEKKGYLWHFGYGAEPTYCREWKTLKGIVLYIEKKYGAIIF